MDEVLDAIAGRRMLELTYGGGRRVVEPHVVGLVRGRAELMAFQVRGHSRSGGLPEWRRFYLDEVSDVRVLEEPFTPRHPVPRGRYGAWDEVVVVVGEDEGPHQEHGAAGGTGRGAS